MACSAFVAQWEPAKRKLGFYIIMNVANCLKKPLTVEEQIKRLKAHNMVIQDETMAAEILGRVNYYRFTGYALQFRVSENNSDFVQRTTFNEVYDIYRFDEELRGLLRVYIEKLEVYFRTIIAYHFSLAKCSLPPHDQHYDESNFFNKKGYQQLRDHFKRDRDYYRDSLVLKHHAKNYNDKLPLWVIVELVSFSDLSKLYSCMFYSEKDRIAKAAGVGYNTLGNNLHCLSVLRNKCAHAARLYNTELNPPVSMNKETNRRNPQIRGNSLFAYLWMLSKRLNKVDRKKFVDSLIILIESYNGRIDLRLMGFPSDWKKIINTYLLT